MRLGTEPLAREMHQAKLGGDSARDPGHDVSAQKQSYRIAVASLYAYGRDLTCAAVRTTGCRRLRSVIKG